MDTTVPTAGREWMVKGMAEYIDRDAALQELKKMSKVKTNIKGEHAISDYFSRVATLLIADSYIRNIPAADVQPVKHAAWDYAMPVDGPERNRYRCSRCSGFALLDYWGNDVRSRYCPECGAIMDDEGKKYWVHYEGELTPAED